MVSDVLNVAFPSTQRKQVGKAQLLHVYGIEEVQEARQTPNVHQQIVDLESALAQERQKNATLTARVHQL